MVDRIRQLLKNKDLNAAQFADAIGVQRSSISHVLSGRNKPSLEFVQKILHAFPDVSSEWLLSGKGSLGNKEIANDDMDLFNSQVSEEENERPGIARMRPEETESKEKPKIIEQKKETPLKEESSIEQVIIFYKNGTMKVYSPD